MRPGSDQRPALQPWAPIRAWPEVKPEETPASCGACRSIILRGARTQEDGCAGRGDEFGAIQLEAAGPRYRVDELPVGGPTASTGGEAVVHAVVAGEYFAVRRHEAVVTHGAGKKGFAQFASNKQSARLNSSIVPIFSRRVHSQRRPADREFPTMDPFPNATNNSASAFERLFSRHDQPSAGVRLGLGCWAIGGPFWAGEQPLGWGEVDDAESRRALRAGFDAGVRFFDTADVYGCGRSERVLGEALADVRDQVVIATKFGNTFDAGTLQLTGQDASPEYLRRACEASLRRLRTDRIDLYQLHLSDLDPRQAAGEVRGTLEELVTAGKVRAYGWSTDDPARAAAFAEGAKHNAAVQHELSLFADAPEMLDLCTERRLASINRSPLAMGLLTGKFHAGSRLGADDVRGKQPAWLRFFSDGQPKSEWLWRLEAVQEILRNDGRTLAQGALAWIWGRSEVTVPIPGFRTAAQAAENAMALTFGPLPQTLLDEVRALLSFEGNP